jgi:hypothetical protein
LPFISGGAAAAIACRPASAADVGCLGRRGGPARPPRDRAVQLNKQFGVSFGKIATLFRERFGLRVTASAIVRALHRVAAKANRPMTRCARPSARAPSWCPMKRAAR